MRRRFGQALRLGVSSAGIALVKTSRWGSEPLVALGEYAFGPGDVAGQLGAGLRALLAEGSWARWPLTVVLADDLARSWQVAPPSGSARLADLEAAAAVRFQQLYGEPASGWTIAASWDPARTFTAAALPRSLHEALLQAAAAHKLALVEVVPQFFAGWNQACHLLPAGSWFALVHDGVLTFGVPDGAALGAIRAGALPASADLAWLTNHAGREALRLGVDSPASVQLAGQVPAAWIDAGAPLLAAAPAGLSAMAALAATGSRT